MAAVGGLGLAALSATADEVALPHQPGDAPTTDVAALATELLAYARAAVGATAAQMDEGDLGGELPILQRAGAWRALLPGVIAALGELESLA